MKRIKGTQDFLDLRLFNFVLELAKKQLQTYHFTEIATPILEPLELFKRSLGLYTDVVSKEMFLIQGNQDEEDAICLRPEATAPTLRAFIENGVQQTPWKVFTWGPMFRYERPQKGRFRQFHQLSMEIVGSASVAQDALFITMLDRFFHEKLHLNNYALVINYLGCFADRKAYQLLLKEFLESPEAGGICSTCVERKDKNVMRIFDCKSPTCQQIYHNAPTITENLCSSCSSEWAQLQEQLHLLSVSYACKPTLVRGLDYYCKTVFEFVSQNLGAQNTFCGGGRYDQLVTQLGGKQDQPSIGAAMGLERLLLLLDPLPQALILPPEPTLHIIIPMNGQHISLALLIADTLMAADFCVDVLVEQDSIKSMLRHANKMGAKYALLIGDEEHQSRSVTVKNMVTGAQETIAQIALVSYLKK
jgi:histidyl-tRNA synthetase